MDIEILLTIGAIILMLVLSAIFNGSETALTAHSRARMHALEQEGNSRAKLVNTLLRNPEKLIGAVLLGNTLVDILAASLASGLAVILVGPAGVAYATGIMTLLIVIFSAVLPKTYALAFADRTALLLAPLMRVMIFVLAPLTNAIQFVVRQLLKLTPGKEDDAANILAAHEEIRGTIELKTMGGAVAKGDADMLGGVLDLRDLQVLDIMVHRTKMQTIDIDDPTAKVVEQVIRSPYTRVPLWKDEPENIVGVLHTKDLLKELARNGWKPAEIDISSVVAPAWFVPDTTSVKDQLNEFLKRTRPMSERKVLAEELQLSLTLRFLQSDFLDRKLYAVSVLTTISRPQVVAMHRMVTGEAGRFPQLGKALIERGMQRGQQRLADWIAQQMERGKLRGDDPLIAAQQFGGLCQSGLFQRHLLGACPRPTTAQIMQEADQATAMFLRAYMP